MDSCKQLSGLGRDAIKNSESVINLWVHSGGIVSVISSVPFLRFRSGSRRTDRHPRLNCPLQLRSTSHYSLSSIPPSGGIMATWLSKVPALHFTG
ncbi:hypothetical protein J6590_032890 [Homalodisca vitripennis]|nr:hypothetical protein J6590_032890 [Homalodisca vitripennis]